MSDSRDFSIDFLRFLGLSLIILAHVSDIPNLLFQLRCFDVPLMIFISGLTSSHKNITNCWQYIIKRTKRLLIPVYIFLTIYFPILLFAIKLHLIPPFLSLQKILDTYLLIGGIGYVWIIRVFLLIMLITPLFINLDKNFNNDKVCLIFILCTIGFQEIIVNIVNSIDHESFFFIFLSEYILYLTGYSILFLCGIRLRYANHASRAFWGYSMVIIICISLGYYYLKNGLPILINNYKYPPHSFFLLFGCTASILLYILVTHYIHYITLHQRIRKCILFVGRNTIWIYLWHIPFVPLSNMITNNCCIRYIIIYMGSVIIFILQDVLIVNKFNFSLKKYLVG